MKTVLLSCLGLVILVSAIACVGRDTQPSPRVVIYQYREKEQGGAYKWDCPVFAAYTDGTVLWRKAWAPSVDAFAITKSRMAEETVRKIESMVAHYGGRTFRLTDSSDPKNITTLWSSGQVLSIIGDWRIPFGFHTNQPSADEALINEHEKQLWSALPSEVHDTLQTIQSFGDTEGKTWRPEKLSVRLQAPNQPRGNAVVWPSRWPQSFARVSESSGAEWIELPGRMLDELLDLFPADGEPKIVMLRGAARYMSIRFIFPAGTDEAKSELDRIRGAIHKPL